MEISLKPSNKTSAQPILTKILKEYILKKKIYAHVKLRQSKVIWTKVKKKKKNSNNNEQTKNFCKNIITNLCSIPTKNMTKISIFS